MGNAPPPPPPPPPIVIIQPEPQPNPFDQMYRRKMIELLVLQAINRYFALQHRGTNMPTAYTSHINTRSNEEIPLQAMGDANGWAMSRSLAEDVEIPQELRDRLMDRDELMEYLEMDIPPEAMPVIAAALRG